MYVKGTNVEPGDHDELRLTRVLPSTFLPRTCELLSHAWTLISSSPRRQPSHVHSSPWKGTHRFAKQHPSFAYWNAPIPVSLTRILHSQEGTGLRSVHGACTFVKPAFLVPLDLCLPVAFSDLKSMLLISLLVEAHFLVNTWNNTYWLKDWICKQTMAGPSIKAEV